MKKSLSWNAALMTLLAALSCLAPREGAFAQQQRIITNSPTAEWSFRGVSKGIVAEPHDLAIVEYDAPSIETYQASSGSETTLSYIPPVCSAVKSSKSLKPHGKKLSTSATKATQMLAGSDLYFVINAPHANIDSSAINELDVVITSSTGDRETITIFEDEADSGRFVGVIGTVEVPPAVVTENCTLSIQPEGVIDISAAIKNAPSFSAKAEIIVLADPYGTIFDSETGEPISGAKITMVDAATGQPATVFAQDGETTWPSSTISGEPITDGAGNVYKMRPGRYWFPMAPVGNYKLVVEPAPGNTVPSKVSPVLLRGLSRENGEHYVISDASFGGVVVLADEKPVQVDIPVDVTAAPTVLQKTASRPMAQAGDAIIYTITASNNDKARIKRDITLVDTPSPFLRLRSDSIKIDGVAAPKDSVTIAPDGKKLTVKIGDLAAQTSKKITYAMTLRADAPAGFVANKVEATDAVGRKSGTEVSIKVLRDNLAGHMVIMGQVTAGACPGTAGASIGLAGVRVMLEDGSYAITDASGRYHFQGITPGTHVVQALEATLPSGGVFVDCKNSTRSAGSSNSQFIIGEGGSLQTGDFHVTLPAEIMAKLEKAQANSKGSTPALPPEGPKTETPNPEDPANAGLSEAEVESAAIQKQMEASSEYVDWIAKGDGPDGWLEPALDLNPRMPAIRVAIRHRQGQTIALRIDGEPVNKLTFEGTAKSKDGEYAVSMWRGVPLTKERSVLSADVLNSFGGLNKTIEREVYFTTIPAKAELVSELTKLEADGRTRPVVAVRILDINGRPMREGTYGEFSVNAPYQSAAQLDQQNLNAVTGMGGATAKWYVKGEDGIASIELAPTMVSGPVRLDFNFGGGEVARMQQLESWMVPGDVEWTLVGLAEGTIGAKNIADNMERAGSLDSDLGKDARVALYAKGRVLGRYILTLAYDSAGQKDDKSMSGAINPQSYYTVFGDNSARQFDAASREKLYLRIESSAFQAIYGDIVASFTKSKLASYNRTATGVKVEAFAKGLQLQGFAADIGSNHKRDEIQGGGISGPYELSSRAIIPNTERVVLEVRDRFRSEIIVSKRELTRFTDYDIDILTGTITFSQPILSRDFDQNPQFIVIDYETDTKSGGEINAGARAEWNNKAGNIRVGATAVSDKGEAARTTMGSVDLRAKIGTDSEIRAEVAASSSAGDSAKGWLVEAQHTTGKVDVLAYASSLDKDYGVGQQSGAELGRSKLGVDSRLRFSEHLSLNASAWQDDGKDDASRRRAAQLQAAVKTRSTDLMLGVVHFDDRRIDLTKGSSSAVTTGVRHRLLGNRLELSANSSIALANSESIDLPSSHTLGASYALMQGVRVLGQYQIAEGENIKARSLSAGFEVTPWSGALATSRVGRSGISGSDERNFASFGLTQALPLTSEVSIDASLDGNRTIGGAPSKDVLVNPEHPAASGGQLGEYGEKFEDFTAFSIGANWRSNFWTGRVRGEYRDGETAKRKAINVGLIRQMGNGSMLGSGVNWSQAEGDNNAVTDIFDASLAFAYRPKGSAIAALGKLEYRSDQVQGAVMGESGGVGRSIFNVNGDAISRRLIASISANYTPYGSDENGKSVQRSGGQLFLATRYNFDRIEGYNLASTTVLAGFDGHFGLNNRLELGARFNLRSNLDDGTFSYSIGPSVGFVPADNVLLTLGYNLAGFKDPDFSAARTTDKGVYASVRVKFDANTLEAMGIYQ